jgi:hypothetical protein
MNAALSAPFEANGRRIEDRPISTLTSTEDSPKPSVGHAGSIPGAGSGVKVQGGTACEPFGRLGRVWLLACRYAASTVCGCEKRHEMLADDAV